MNKIRHVWIINHYATHPADRTGGSRHQSLAAQLTESGWKVTIIAASTDHSNRVQRSQQALNSSLIDGVAWHWIPCPAYERHGALRLWNIVVFTARLLLPKWTAPLEKPDVVIGSTVHPLAAYAAMKLANRRGVPFVFEIRDLWPETLIDMGVLARRGAAARAMRLLERKLCRSAKLIVTTMPAAIDYLRSHGIDRTKVLWISNGADVEHFDPTAAVMGSHFEFLYFGAHGKANDLETILEAFALATQTTDRCRLTFIGDGSQKTALRRQAIRLGVAELVTFMDPVPRSEIPALAKRADALVISILPLDLYRFGISMNKLFEYMSSARPILFIGNPINNPVDDACAGICVLNNSPVDASRGMIELMESTPDQRTAWGRNGREHVLRHYSYTSLASKLDSALATLL